MKKEVRGRLLIVALIIILTTMGKDIRANGGLLEEYNQSEISLHFNKASFSEENDLSFASSVITLRGQAKLPSGFFIIGELPLSNYDDNIGGEGTGFLIGNPYLGFRYERQGSSPVFTLGFRPALISEESEDYGAILIGAYTDFEKFEAFFPEVTTIYLSGGYKYSSPAGITLRASIGSTLLNQGDPYDDELLADGRLEFFYEQNRLLVGFGIGTRVWLTEQGLDFGERNLQSFKFSLGYSFNRIIPSLHFAAPLDDDDLIGVKENINYVWGIDLKVALGQ